MSTVNLLAEDAINESFDLLVGGKVEIGHAEDWFLGDSGEVADSLVLFGLDEIVHSVPFVRVELGLIVLVLLVVFLLEVHAQGSVDNVELIFIEFGFLEFFIELVIVESHFVYLFS